MKIEKWSLCQQRAELQSLDRFWCNIKFSRCKIPQTLCQLYPPRQKRGYESKKTCVRTLGSKGKNVKNVIVNVNFDYWQHLFAQRKYQPLGLWPNDASLGLTISKYRGLAAQVYETGRQ